MTQLEYAKKGTLTPLLEAAARAEGVSPAELSALVAQGLAVVPANPLHPRLRPMAVGKNLRTKVNVNIGTSKDCLDLPGELQKVDVSLEYEADTIMDLSTGGDLRAIRRSILDRAPIPLETVPIYQAAIEAIGRRGSVVEMTADDLFASIEDQAREGVDFMTVHCGLTLRAIDRMKSQGRVADIVSRGGAFHLAWSLHHGKENPLFEQFDRLLELARTYDFTLSLGDGLRPGSIIDATDRCQIEELLTLGELVKRSRERGVQVMVEGPGHVPLDQVEMNVKLQKSVCHGAPFYVLGPIVTDIGAGYDHIVGAIGGAIAAAAGADFLCYVTPAEHLGLPTVDDVREGLIASRIAGHAADIVKGLPGARERDLNLSRARKKLDWKGQQALALDPRKFESTRRKHQSGSAACSMCGDFCAMRLVSEFLDTPGDTDVEKC